MLREGHGKGEALQQGLGRSNGEGKTMPPSDWAPTELLRSRLLASPTALRALSTSRWPGRQLTQRFRAWVTALAT